MNATEETTSPVEGDDQTEQRRPQAKPGNGAHEPCDEFDRARRVSKGRHPHALQEGSIPADLVKPSPLAVTVMVVVLLGLMAAFFVLGWIPHERAAAQADADADAAKPGPPIVQVANPRPEKTSQDVWLPCDVKANQQTAVYARANGFLKQWNYDIGAHVNKGDLLAVIDAPDLDAQVAATQATLEQAKATVIKSEADVDVAQTDYNRYLKAQKDSPGSVTQEDIDTKRAAYADAVGALDVAKATVAQDEAQVRQLQVSQQYEQVIAPFTGTITARNYDVGALISPSNTAAGSEMFDIADTATLRVFVNVPQNYSTQIRAGQPAYLTVQNYPGREFTGVVARMAGALDLTTRTLPYELDFSNSTGELYPGMYGQARLPITEDLPSLVVNTSALIFNASGVQMALVRDNKIHLQQVTVGRDLGTELEITKGLTRDDQVVVNPSERLTEGAQVQVAAESKPVTADAPANGNPTPKDTRAAAAN
ncbi:MAG: efflux RND transporter periplasmic adaptor subunit [Tepidisphaeraceae bacterium]|jgi:RND family efflux transporter MFP subunit